MFGFCQGRFAEDHPGFIPCIIYRLPVLFKQGLFFQMPFDAFHQLGPEHQAELSRRVKELSTVSNVL
jgi:hypothetical protein